MKALAAENGEWGTGAGLGVDDLEIRRSPSRPQSPWRMGRKLEPIRRPALTARAVDGKTEASAPGSLIYEPFGLAHQWGNPGDAPLTFLAFNINPEGIAAVLPGAPAKPQ